MKLQAELDTKINLTIFTLSKKRSEQQVTPSKHELKSTAEQKQMQLQYFSTFGGA